MRLRNVSKRYALGMQRYVSVKKQDGELTVTVARRRLWQISMITYTTMDATTLAAMNAAWEKQILAKQFVKFNRHLHGRIWQMSVTKGYLRMDWRERYDNLFNVKIFDKDQLFALLATETNVEGCQWPCGRYGYRKFGKRAYYAFKESATSRGG